MSAPATEGAARGSGGATSGELSLVPVLGARVGRSAFRTRSEPTSLSTSEPLGGGRSRCIDGQELSQAQPRRAEHH
jgi:hypothetical protein